MISPFALEPMPSQRNSLDIAAALQTCRQDSSSSTGRFQQEHKSESHAARGEEHPTAKGTAAAGADAIAGENAAAAAFTAPVSGGGLIAAARRVSFQKSQVKSEQFAQVLRYAFLPSWASCSTVLNCLMLCTYVPYCPVLCRAVL